jgi:putative transposase
MYPANCLTNVTAGYGLLVIVGVTPEGKKERVAIGDGYHELKESWKDLLLDLKKRNLGNTE